MSDDPELIEEIKGHKNTLLCSKFSPDGNSVIAAGVENIIYFHRLNQSNYFYKIYAHDDIIYSLDYGRYSNTNVPFFLSASRDQTVKLWKISSTDSELTNQEFEPITYRCHNNTIRFVNICPVNSGLFCTGSDDKTVKVWSSVVPNKRLNTFSSHTNWIRCCKFSRRSSDLIASCGDDSTFRLFDMRIDGKKGSILKTITTERNRHFTYLDWFPLSEYFIAVSSSNNMIRVFDLRKTANIIQFYKPFVDSVNCIDFHPSGHYLLACSSDATSKLINVVEGRLLYTLKGHYKSIFNCTFDRNGLRFMTCGKDRSMKIWKLNLDTKDSQSTDCESMNTYADRMMERMINKCDKVNAFYGDTLNSDVITSKRLPSNSKRSSNDCSTDNLDMNYSLTAAFTDTKHQRAHFSDHHHHHLTTYSNNCTSHSAHQHSRIEQHNFVDQLPVHNEETSSIDLELINQKAASSRLKRSIGNQMNKKQCDSLTRSEFDEIFSQLNLLENSLFKLERRLNNLETRLEGR